jgi:DNA-binding transcriptional LysR family regulator
VTDHIESIAAFVRVAREGSFSAAARKMGVSPSAISKRIARLESDLGVGLFNRTTRKLALSDVGRDFFDRCARSLSIIEEAVELTSSLRGVPSGLLRARVPQAFGRLHIAPALPEFMSRFPEIQLDMAFGRLEGNMMDERIDVLVASSDPPDANLTVKSIAPIERVTCVSPSYIDRFGRPAAVEDLARHNCLMFTGSGSVEDEWVLHEKKGVRRINVSGSYRTNDAEAIYMAVLAGVGIAHMPTYIAGPSLASGKLLSLFRDAGTRGGASMKVYYPPSKHRLPKVQVFLDFLVALFKTHQWQSDDARPDKAKAKR